MFSLNLGNLVVHLLADTRKYTKDIIAAQTFLESTSKKLTSIGQSMSMHVTAPLSLIGGLSVRNFATFDDAMTQSLAIMSGVSGDMRKQMEDVAKQIAGDSITAPEELAKSYYYLASAGLDATQSVAALPRVEKFAVAGMFDMAQATDLLTDAQSALGLSSKDAQQNMINMTRLSDVLVRANTLANASVEQFSRALTNKAAAALRLLNKDVEEGVAVLAAFADQGVKDVEAGEKLHIVLRDLQTSVLKESAAWNKMGMSVYNAEGKMLPLADIIAQLEEKFSGMSDEQKKATAEMLGFQDRSFSALQTLLGTSSKIRMYESELRKAGGTTDRIANEQLKSFNSQLKNMWNNIKLASIELGNTMEPWIRRLAVSVKDATIWFRSLDNNTKKWIAGIGIGLAIIGPFLLSLGLMSGSLKNLVLLFTTLKLGMIVTVGKIALIVGGILALIDVLSGGELGFNDFIGDIIVGGFTIRATFEYSATYIVQVWRMATGVAALLWSEFIYRAQSLGTDLYQTYLKVAMSIANTFWSAVQDVFNGFIWLVDKVMTLGKSLHLIDEKEVEKVKGVLEKIKGAFDKTGSDIRKGYEEDLKKSLDASRERALQHLKEIRALGEDFMQNAAPQVWDDTRAAIALRDLEEQAAKDKRKREIERALAQAEAAAAAAQGPAAPQPATSFSPSQYKEISLRRFSLTQPATSPQKKQDVQDTQVADKLEKIYQEIRNPKVRPTVLG